MVLIGLVGSKGSGKTTGAEYLTKQCDYVEKSFADPLKEACKHLFLLDDHQVYGTQEQKETPDPRWFDCTPRKILQYVGTDLLRNNLDNIMPGLGHEIFTRHFKLWYEAEIKKNPNIKVVISDVRFHNEAEFIKKLGGFLIKIERPGSDNFDFHASEIELKSIQTDIIISNVKSINEYYQNLDTAINIFETKMNS
ncbi:putative deoxynucleotide monophosphate kinase [Cotonvirus japonicus]|uniref:Deoxynucleotide monophosphate kinase n=1 Tax=Cotonvirus japonicus TaxID=2811091 RepID=A0ABM7NT84_9VIRU|nr:putative deoxynucleotide monophosphate kinase [Cotonvirus japonicus]BCS83311.1 putative deoxynucleotide monophosphate kinase [Cotonvirus japonicus]